MQSDQSEQEPEEVGQSKKESEEIGQFEKEIENVLNVNEEPESDVPDFISNRDVGLINFDTNTGKPILSNRMRAEITKLGSKYFQNSHEPFLPKNNCAMSSNWFKRKLANGEEVTRSWLMYSPSKKSRLLHLLSALLSIRSLIFIATGSWIYSVESTQKYDRPQKCKTSQRVF